MKKNWKHTLMATLLAVGLLLSVPGIAAQAVDLDADCSLTVDPGTFEDLENAQIVIDLYKVADLASGDPYDTYTFSATAAYSTLQDQLEDPDWTALAAQAAELTLASGQTIAKAVDAAPVNETIDALEGGLYLLVARGPAIDEYVTTVEAEDGSQAIATIAYSDEYVYTFLPELVALPSKAADGPSDTSDPSEWVYDLTPTLKPEQSVRFGDLEIVKTLDSFVGSEQATFVFDIEAAVDGETVYSNVAALNFTAAGTKRIEITGQIPVGAEVTVTEVYTGAAYSLTTAASQQAVIVAPDAGTASVGFTNTYSGENRGGHGIINHFTLDESGSWAVDNTGDNAA